MKHQLNPWSWVAALKSVISGKLPVLIDNARGAILDRLLVNEQTLQRLLCRTKVEKCPAITLPASVVAPILGLKDSAVSKAMEMRLLPNTSLQELARFRDENVFPSEIRSWFGHSPGVFRNTMWASGFVPVATVMNLNIWRRKNVEHVFPESVKMNLYREWSQTA